MKIEDYVKIAIKELSTISTRNARENYVNTVLLTKLISTPPDLLSFFRLALEALDNEPLSEEYKKKLDKLLRKARYIDFETAQIL